MISAYLFFFLLFPLHFFFLFWNVGSFMLEKYHFISPFWWKMLKWVTVLPLIEFLFWCLFLTGKYMFLLFVSRETEKNLMEACSPERAQEIIHSFYTLSLLPKCNFNGKVKWCSLNMKAEWVDTQKHDTFYVSILCWLQQGEIKVEALLKWNAWSLK